MSGTASSTQGAKTPTAAIGYAINARWPAVHARAELRGVAVWVSVPPNLGPTAYRGILSIVSRIMGRTYELVAVDELDRRVRLIYQPANRSA